MTHGTWRDQQFPSAKLERPQPEFRVNFTLAVVDLPALWAAAAARLLEAPGMTLGDVLDVIGPREDPSIIDCITALARPTGLAGCLIDDFWIDGLRGCPPRADIASIAHDYRLAAAEAAPRRLRAKRPVAPRVALSLIPPKLDDATPNR